LIWVHTARLLNVNGLYPNDGSNAIFTWVHTVSAVGRHFTVS
jgi:hypothetical protein